MRHHSDVHFGGGGNDCSHCHAANHCGCRRLLAVCLGVFRLSDGTGGYDRDLWTTGGHLRPASDADRRIIVFSCGIINVRFCLVHAVPHPISRDPGNWRRLDPADRYHDYRGSLRTGRARHDSRLFRLSLGHRGYYRSTYRKYHRSADFMVMDFLAEYPVWLVNNSWAESISA